MYNCLLSLCVFVSFVFTSDDLILESRENAITNAIKIYKSYRKESRQKSHN